MTPVANANLLAGHAVAHATSYLDGRNTAEQLAGHVRRLHLELLAAPQDLAANQILNPVRLLTVAMTHTAAAAAVNRREENIEPGDHYSRQDRWEAVMGALVELVRTESRILKDEGHFA
jgi:hypothetical protein